MTSLQDLKNNLPLGKTEDYKSSIKWENAQEAEVTQVTKSAPDYAEQEDYFKGFLKERGYDPEVYFIENDSIRRSEWQTFHGDWLYSYRYKISRRPEFALDIQEVLDNIWTEGANDKPITNDTRVIVLSDQHIGKSEEAGGGTPLLIERWKSGVVRAIGNRRYRNLVIVLGGDIIEGYTSQNGKNISTCDLTLQEQIRTATQLVVWTINQALKVADDVIISAVPGNHGESTRVQGTDMCDSYDILIPAQAKDAFDLRFDSMEEGDFLKSRLKWVFPDNRYGSVTFDAGSTTICSVHGHKFRGKPLPGAEKWWSDHIMNSRPEGAAQILIAGHFHTFQMLNATKDRWILFAPGLETESTWFANSTGSTSKPGVLAFDAVEGEPRNVSVF